MTKTNKKNRPARSGRKKPEPSGRSQGCDDAQDKLLGRYTPKQRERIHNGLRIWARVAIRSYLRKHGGESQASTDLKNEDED